MKKDIAFIVTAISGEENYLEKCLRFIVDGMKDSELSYSCIIVFQTTSNQIPDFLTKNPNTFHVIRFKPLGVSAARNRGLVAALSGHRQIMFVDCRVLLSPAFCQTLGIKAARSSPLWVGNVQWSAVGGISYPMKAPRPGQHYSLIRLAYEGFAWRCVIASDVIGKVRFREDLGPGSKGDIQAGEDCLFLIDLALAAGISDAFFCDSAFIDRIPRDNPMDKRQIYAKGEGYRLGYFIRTLSLQRPSLKLIHMAARFLVGTAYYGIFLGRVGRRLAWRRFTGVMLGLLHPQDPENASRCT